MIADTPGVALARVDHARQLLAEARTIDEVKDVRDKAEAIRQYSRTAGMTVDIQNYAAEIKIRAERRAGELLAEMPKRDGGDAMKARSHVDSELPPKLSDLGITHNQSHRFQEVAAIPEPVFEQAIAETKALAQEAIATDHTPPREAILSTAGLTRLARQKQAEQEAADVQFVLDSAPDDGGRLAQATTRAAYSRGVLAVHRLRDLDPDEIAAALREGDAASARWFIRDTRAWLDRLEAALSRGIRLLQTETAGG